MPSVFAFVRECIHPSLCLSYLYINLYISFIYKDIFTEFARDVYGCKNLSVQNFGLILKIKTQNTNKWLPWSIV